jgi:Protein of unknown function (DUF1553)/Protein of unknown function (DUF1549)
MSMPSLAERPRLRASLVCIACIVVGLPSAAPAAGDAASKLWVLKPLVRPDVPAGLPTSSNPIDAFLAAEQKAKGLGPAGPAERRSLLRRVYLDLIGLPPTPAEQDAFLHDPAPDAYEKVVDRLLASPQHGVRYARHWLDVLRYADVDERMIAAPGIYLWRDWVISALNSDLPYDEFVRAQLTGYRTNVRTTMSATGYRSRLEPRPDDMFALGFLARGAVLRDGKDGRELSMSAVETVSTAFMGLTVGCAKCHNHFYDPIKQRDFYSMKALFDPLIIKKIVLASPAEILANGKATEELERKRSALEKPLEDLIAPYKKRLYDQRVAMLPDDVRPIILKAEKDRTPLEQKIADDYYPILRIDAEKYLPLLSEADKRKYRDLQSQLAQLGGGRKRGGGLPAFWTVEVDHQKEHEKTYILTSGDPERPETNHEVQPGWPFAPANLNLATSAERGELAPTRVEAFSDWLTAPDNPLFARVAVNRLWQWHFGEGLHKTPNDFGKLSGDPANPRLLDWLASEFVRRKFSMREMHRLIVTSDAYKRASEVSPDMFQANRKADPTNAFYWRFPLQRLEAEPIWDSILTAAGNLDLTVGGSSFDVGGGGKGRRFGGGSSGGATNRRAAYMIRGYSTSRDVVPTFLQAFDVDDGRAPCPLRTQTVTAPQALFLMNSDAIDQACVRFAARLRKESGGNLHTAIDLGYRIALARLPSPAEMERSLAYLENDPARLKGFAWLLFNLDEFIYVR